MDKEMLIESLKIAMIKMYCIHEFNMCNAGVYGDIIDNILDSFATFGVITEEEIKKINEEAMNIGLSIGMTIRDIDGVVIQ